MGNESKGGNGGNERLTVTIPRIALVKRAAEDLGPLEHLHDDVTPPSRKQSLLLKAHLAFVTDLHQRPIESFYPVVEPIMSRTEFVRIAAAEEWRRERDRLIAATRNQMMERIDQELVRAQIEELRELEGMRKRVRDLIGDVKGLETLGEGVLALTRLTAMIKDYRQALATKLQPDGATVVEADEHVSSDEAAEMARMILRKRLG